MTESLIEKLVTTLEHNSSDGWISMSSAEDFIADVVRQHQAEQPQDAIEAAAKVRHEKYRKLGQVEQVPWEKLLPIAQEAAIVDARLMVEAYEAAKLACSEISDTGLTALDALTFLVALKSHKDQFGKTPYYEMWQPRAWERAIKALGNESMRQTVPVSVTKCLEAVDALGRAWDDRSAAKAVLDAAGVKYVP